MGPLSREEAILILEGIARDGSPSLQIQAIRLLFQVQDGGKVDEDDLERILRTK
jgi:hypothetical protein